MNTRKAEKRSTIDTRKAEKEYLKSICVGDPISDAWVESCADEIIAAFIAGVEWATDQLTARVSVIGE